MKLRTLAAVALLSTTSLVAPAKAQEPATGSSTPIAQRSAGGISGSRFEQAQSQPTRTEIANACIQNQAETLPIPFSDVSPNDWAFKAVMTMYYCGAFRQAAPPSLFQQTAPTQN